MTPQEQQLLKSLTDRVNQTQLQEKDPDADNMLGRELGANPDALYILAQTVLVQNIALNQAQAQVAQLHQQLQQASQPAHSTSFLGRLLGDREPEPPQPPYQQPPYQPVPQYAQPQYAPPPPPQYGQPQYQQPQYVPVQGGQPSFLRGAMQTAAGVAAGALAFEGVESILHGMGGHGGYGWGGPGMGMGSGMGAGFERPVEENVVNNYYDQPGGREGEHHGSEGDPHSHEPADQTAANDDSGNNMAGFDDGASNDTAGFDSGGQDDGGGGFDDGGGGDSGGDSF